MMEKICEWYWKPEPKEPRQKCSWWFDTDKIMVKREIEGQEAVFDAPRYVENDVMPIFEQKGRNRLTDISKMVYDFLKAKGF